MPPSSGRATAARTIFLALLAMLAPGYAIAAAEDAEIVLLIGRGERRGTAEDPWSPAALKDRLAAGAFVRTLANSQMGLLMPDRTQLRLNQNSQLQIKSVAEAAQWSQSTVRLNAGRAWSQARPQPATLVTPPGGLPSVPLIMETPSTTMSIRGTDWEVEVGPDGRTQLVVLSGTVDMANAQGTLSIAAGEAAIAEIGKAPVRLLLVNPQSRVQWVSQWKPQPRRWAADGAERHAAVIRKIESGDYAEAISDLRPLAGRDVAAALLLADLWLHQGELAAAIAALSEHSADGAGNPTATALLAYALARSDRRADAERVVASALGHFPGHIELLLAQGELAILDGEVERARRAFAEVLARQPGNAEGWYGLGLIESERENVRLARNALGEALARDGRMSKASAELAATETFAGNLDAARAILGELLSREPDNYVALTALGINKLRSGLPREALEDFLKAGLIEPRYARAWLYSGISFYQLGEKTHAVEAFQKAARLDERDPVPHLIESIVQADALDFGAAIEAARQAQGRMPYLKSLNQVVSNQKGNANLGSALANFGMEQWAGYYAAQAYSPYWGGSHLFRADRHTGLFNKNSELFTGYLTEPTVFGASNRFSTLIPAPGHYGRIDTIVERSDFLQGAAIGTLNGMAVSPIPVAYFVSGDLSAGDSRKDPTTAGSKGLTLGLGARPQHDIGLFGFGTDTQLDATLHTPSLSNDRMRQTDSRGDVGANFKLAAENQLWFKAGQGRQSNDITGEFTSQTSADALNRAFGTTIFTANGQLNQYRTLLDQEDVQFRHAFTAGPVQWTWGVEQSQRDRTAQLVTTFTPVRGSLAEASSVRATDLYASGRYQNPGVLDVQADLFGQHSKLGRRDSSIVDVLVGSRPRFILVDSTLAERHSELNPRLGAKWQLGPFQSLSAVSQTWRRPASVGTLSPIETVGIALNDRLPGAGGLYRRQRLQFDGEIGRSSFVQAFVDHERIDNGIGGRASTVSDLGLTQLQTLRNYPDVFPPRADLEDTPRFVQGSVDTFGFAINHLIDREQTVSMRYLRRNSRQTGALDGLRIPLVPRDFLELGTRWSLPGRWQIGPSAVYRSERFRDDTNLERIAPGWWYGMTVYWESADKRSSVQAVLDNLLSNREAGYRPDTHLLLRYSYRF